jgi:hypothetical protein
MEEAEGTAQVSISWGLRLGMGKELNVLRVEVKYA